MLAVPALTPVTNPVLEPIVAMPVLPLLHVPPVVALARVDVVPAHIAVAPVIAAGSGFTVIIVVVIQPVGRA